MTSDYEKDAKNNEKDAKNEQHLLPYKNISPGKRNNVNYEASSGASSCIRLRRVWSDCTVW